MPRLSIFKTGRSTPTPERSTASPATSRDGPPSSFRLKPNPRTGSLLTINKDTPVAEEWKGGPQRQPLTTHPRGSEPSFHPRGHVRAASGPLPPSHRPALRNRSLTSSESLPNGPVVTPPRRRPTALRLRTSNLVPELTPIPSKSSSLLPQRSVSNTRPPSGAMEVLGSDDSQQTLQPITPQGASNSTPAAANRPASDKPRAAHMKHSRSASSLNSSASPFTATSNRPFENVPLPWTAHSVEELEEMLGKDGVDSLVDFTISHLPMRPNLLPPSLLRAGASEEARLRLELSRLREKYDRMIQQRDALFHQLEHSFVKTELSTAQRTLAALQKTTARCDRVARQMYVCNDQIRQIELQGEGHIVGAVQIALAKERGRSDQEESSDARPLSGPQGVPLPDRSSRLHLSQFDFPLPPERPLQVRVEAASEIGDEDAEAILIYPPSHRRSTSAPLSATKQILPHTPVSAHLDLPSPQLISASRATAPLRLAVPKAHRRARTQSRIFLKPDDPVKRSRGRDTQLQTSESILLSLATAIADYKS